MKTTFKPKKAFIHVPGYGVVSREDFGAEHTKALLKRAEKHGVDQDAFIKQHLVIDSYGDLEIFNGPEDNGKGTAEDVTQRAVPGGKKGGKKKEVPVLDDEAELEKLIAEEAAKA